MGEGEGGRGFGCHEENGRDGKLRCMVIDFGKLKFW